MRSNIATAVVLAIAAASSACGAGPGAFVCKSSDECRLDTVVGTCQPDGWCSFPDDACPSGDRYGMHAGDGNAGACVGQGDGSTDTPPGSTMGDASSTGALTSASSEPSSSDASLTLGVGSSSGPATDAGGSSDSGPGESTSASTSDSGPEPLPCTFEDEFLGMALDEDEWIFWEENGAAIQVADGLLTVDLPVGVVSVAGIQRSAGDLHGHAVAIVIGAGPNPASTAEQSLIFNQDGGDFRVTITTGEVYVSTYDGTYEVLAVEPIDVGTYDHLRVGEEDGVMFVERSAGPGAWETIWEGAPPIAITDLTLTARVQTWEPVMDPGDPAYDAIRICPLP